MRGARVLLSALFALGFAASGAPPALAALGGSEASIPADGQLQSSAQARSFAASTIDVRDTTVLTPSGVTVHEYSGTAGVVFAIAWSGPTMPDLQQLLGSYFPAYAAWLKANPPQSYRAPVEVRDARIVAHAWGHMRAYEGSAYAPALLPPGVDLRSLGVQS